MSTQRSDGGDYIHVDGTQAGIAQKCRSPRGPADAEGAGMKSKSAKGQEEYNFPWLALLSAGPIQWAESVSKNQPPSALRRPSGAEAGEAAHSGRSRAADVGEGLPPPPTKKLRARAILAQALRLEFQPRAAREYLHPKGPLNSRSIYLN